jgi:plastocyanin
MLIAFILMSFVKTDSIVSGRIAFANGRPAPSAVITFISPDRPKPKPLAKAVVDQRDRTFLPHVSVVTVGTQVDFPNNDIVFHNVFTEFNSTKFDLGNYPKGTSKSQVFKRPGLAVILCSIHPDMGAYVMVVDTPYYALSDKKGRFQISGVPAGRYTVEVWHESGAKSTSEVTISGPQQVDISLHR